MPLLTAFKSGQALISSSIQYVFSTLAVLQPFAVLDPTHILFTAVAQLPSPCRCPSRTPRDVTSKLPSHGHGSSLDEPVRSDSPLQLPGDLLSLLHESLLLLLLPSLSLSLSSPPWVPGSEGSCEKDEGQSREQGWGGAMNRPRPDPARLHRCRTEHLNE